MQDQRQTFHRVHGGETSHLHIPSVAPLSQNVVKPFGLRVLHAVGTKSPQSGEKEKRYIHVHLLGRRACLLSRGSISSIRQTVMKLLILHRTRPIGVLLEKESEELSRTKSSASKWGRQGEKRRPPVHCRVGTSGNDDASHNAAGLLWPWSQTSPQEGEGGGWREMPFFVFRVLHLLNPDERQTVALWWHQSRWKLHANPCSHNGSRKFRRTVPFFAGAPPYNNHNFLMMRERLKNNWLWFHSLISMAQEIGLSFVHVVVKTGGCSCEGSPHHDSIAQPDFHVVCVKGRASQWFSRKRTKLPKQGRNDGSIHHPALNFLSQEESSYL